MGTARRSLKLPGCLMSLRLLLSPEARKAIPTSGVKRQEWLWAEKQGSVDMPLPTSDQKSDLQTCVRSANTSLSFPARVKLQRNTRVLRNRYQKIAIPLGFSIVHCMSFLGR